MNEAKLQEMAHALTHPGKGVLAADTSDKTTKKRFDAVGVESTADTRREYRELLFTTPGVEEFLSGVILYDETFWQNSSTGQIFRGYLNKQGITPGIKVDKGLVDLPGFPGEKVPEGLDGLTDRMRMYSATGASFAKWRSVIAIGDNYPTDECIGANTLSLARYARICQDADVVPIVEPEVLFDGKHSAERCEQVMAHTLDILFNTLRAFRVYLPGVVLKTSFVLPGKDSGTPINHDEVADRTSRVLHHHVPHELGGIVFLSGGQTSRDAFINLNKIAQRGPHPWGLTFSYDRALQDPVLKAWAKDRSNVEAAQSIFRRQLQLAVSASKGELNEQELDQDDFVTKGQDT